MRTWIIGSGEGSDIVVAQPRVSRRHCRFTELPDGYLVEDLGSSNGTYVNGERIGAGTRVSAGDRITLGALVPLPWPPTSGAPGATILRIGRAADNDIVLDDARVSSHHARLIVSAAGRWIEDVGSANGTYVNAPDRRATEPLPLGVADTVYLGSLAVPATRLLSSREAPRPAPPPLPPTPAEPLRPATTATRANWWPMAQAPALGLLILLAFAGQIASITFALAISAVWLGGSLAVWAGLGWPVPTPDTRRFAGLGGLCILQCAVLLAIVSLGSGLGGPWLAMLGILVLASAVGFALGLLVFRLVRDPVPAVSILLVAFLAMVAMGGRIWPLPGSSAVATIAAAMPSRWAFEGLLLLEGERHAPPASTGEAAPAAADLADDYFPAGSERMGPRADAMALGFMLIGLAAAVAYLSAAEKTSPLTGAER